MKLRKIIKEEVDNFEWASKISHLDYKTCSHFEDKDQVTLCRKLNSLADWLHKDLGMRGVIDGVLKDVKVFKDLTNEYQYPLSVLHSTGQYSQIKLSNGVYTHSGLFNAGLVFDEGDEYHYVNKLNTNYSDLAELLTELLTKGGKIKELANKNILGIKEYLTSIKSVLGRLIEKHFNVDDIKSFIRNTVSNTRKGDHAENYAADIFTKFGSKVLYQGGNGDFMDMLFGVDLILEHKGRIITCQVKNRESLLPGAMGNRYYSKINYFVSPIKDGGEGIVVYNKKGDKFSLNNDGQLIR
jgi:hypothetical protein